ncbi:Compactin diketide synthase mokB [Trichoderma ghanense]|uniref:Compactin diketide synthase mokB n=1 Tax=Trichoderma ghanense TaxID=65468 RepID=A0ABY2H8S4_9HYPO
MSQPATVVDMPAQANDDIAVVGFSFRLPQDLNDDMSFWEALDSRRNLMTSCPEDRMNATSFLDTNANKPYARGAHFITDDVACFDAPFFSVTAKEAAAMDPMQRMTLETSYRAFEKAGFTTDALRGSKTAVFHASMLEDYARLMAMDPDNVERTTVTGGTVPCMVPNRISWFFDLRGPSVHVNTACSSGLVAVDMACKTLRSGDASCALVTGANLLLDPTIFHLLSYQNFLSPDSRSYSFDQRANGYARGEGIIAVVLKPVSAAVRDGDMIRAVIRASGSNQDGHTPVITQPSQQAQQDLIQHVYQQANLSLAETRYVEAHGTGTPVGDPIEARAIGRVFRKFRSEKEPLYIGSVKSNIGHLEGASGLAGLLKVILSLERGIIPPNALFETINPTIDAEFWNIAIPNASIPWPSKGIRRASLNSFGFGGSNTHVVVDDALSYLKDRNLPGNHCTVGTAGDEDAANGWAELPPSPVSDDFSDQSIAELKKIARPAVAAAISSPPSTIDGLPRLLVWSAADEQAAKRALRDQELFYKEKIAGSRTKLDRLAYTLAARRSHMLWRSFAIVTEDGRSEAQDGIADFDPVKPMRSSPDATLAFVFTGQGAQYTDMGWDLVKYPVFADTLRQIDSIYQSLGCTWSIFDELRSSKNINLPEYSQPLSTAVQIALLELLASFGIAPKAVVGHSSGEIAAAYAIGALSLQSACKVSYFRGHLAGKLRAANEASPGAMMSINLAEANVSEYLSKIGAEASSVCVACINSPLNCTLSGPEAAIDAIKAQADNDGIFAQKLKTGVAYHSQAMEAIADEYLALMGSLEGASRQDPKVASGIPMVSSVSGKVVRPAALAKGQYWVNNMVSPVRFADAVQLLTQEPSKVKVGLSNITDLVEIGSHPALRRVAQDTIRQVSNKKRTIRYSAALQRSHPPIKTTLELVGQLFCLGHNVSIAAVNQTPIAQSGSVSKKPAFLVDTPEYPFDRSHKYWVESRISRDFRFRGNVKGDVLGARVSDWNPLLPRWRNLLAVESIPWAGHHKVTDTLLYPAAGMLVMAIEAVQQMIPDNREVAGFLVKEAEFLNPIIIHEKWEDRTETQVHLRPLKTRPADDENGPAFFEVDIFSYTPEGWKKCFHASLKVDYEDPTSLYGKERRHISHAKARDQYDQAVQSCALPIDSATLYRDAAEVGLQYGEWFQLLRDVRWDSTATAVARVDVSKDRYKTKSLVHPSVLDQAFHVLRVSAGQQPTANVPARLKDAWFASSSKWQSPGTGNVRWMATSTSAAHLDGTQGYGEQGTVIALADDGTVLCTIEQATTASISNNAKATDKKLLYSVEWKPQLSMLQPEQLGRICKADSFENDETAILQIHQDMCLALELYSIRVLQKLDRTKVPEALTRHVDWMEHHIGNMSPENRRLGETISDEDLESRLVEVEKTRPAWKLYTTCARRLLEMLSGEVDPLQVVFGSDQAELFYAELFQKLCQDGRLRAFLDLVAHERPAQRILEVGAGTGGMTGHVLSLLQQREERLGGSSFSEYTYTDISPMFFERARERWPDLASQGRLTFKTFNVDRPIDEQGFEPGSYDICVAASVLHAVPYLESSLKQVRRALRPGGRLILLEVIDPEDIATNFMAGLVPGWWVAKEDWRPHSAAIPEKLWDKCLRNNGFSGNDVIFRDYKSEACHIVSIILTTAVEEPRLAPVIQPSKLVIVVDEQKSYLQTRMAELVQQQLDPQGSRASSVCAFSLDELSQSLENLTEDDTVVCIAEVNSQPLLSNLSEQSFKSLQYLVGKASKLLWVTGCSTESEEYADYGAAQGFFRSIRVEQSSNRIITLAMEGKLESLKIAQLIESVFNASFGPSASDEVEYLVKDGLLMTGRAIEDVSGNETLNSLLSHRLQEKTWYDGPALQLSVGSQEGTNKLQFVRDRQYESKLAPSEVEIDARAWGVDQRDVQTALGRRQEVHRGIRLGVDCAGIVTRVGTACESINPGDRVCMVVSGCMRQYPRGDVKAVCKIPESMSFEEATSALIPAMTAYHALVDVARLVDGDKVLIHAAAVSAVGQFAVRIAQMQGAQVIVTYSTPLERDALKQMGLAEDHIVDSSTITFAQRVMELTGGEGVDALFNLLAEDDIIQASYECLASGGRFLEMKRPNAVTNASIPIGVFDRNISFSIIDIVNLNPKTTGRLLKKTMELLEQGRIGHAQPLRTFNASEAEKAFQELQGGGALDRVIIMPQAGDVVPKLIQEQRSWRFDENASYMIAGGSGGLGRGIARWMADRGAKNLILPSRSGASSKAARQTVEELTARGVNVVAPKCDVSSEKELADLLDVCARTMPPIKGCINAAMVLQGAVFQDSMTFAQWELTMRSKRQTSWNLHRLLPADLDFFIMLSSLAGVVGQLASANYSTGCSFQDALARQRLARGQAALSLDIGWMRNIGIVSETGEYQKQRESFDDMKQVDDVELLALLSVFCDPGAPQPPIVSEARGQVLFGLKTPIDCLARGRNPPQLMDRPFFASFSVTAASGVSAGVNANAEAAVGVRFRQASDSGERTQVVLDALAGRLARAMSIATGDVELNKSLSHYGVDSLMSVDLRNWILRDFGALLTAFDIMGGASISRIADMIVERSTVGKL